MTKIYKICQNCVMDTTDTEIIFDDKGICNHCTDSIPRLKKIIFSTDKVENNLMTIKKKIREKNFSGYDCIIGLSGGVDSSYLCLLAKEMKLNALIVHLDNGWNSIDSIKNIKIILKETKFDFETYVIDWNEFVDIQRSFLFAGVPDIEIVSDHAYYASLYKIAKKKKIKFILSGYNFNTEHSMPKKWIWRKSDIIHIKAIHKKFGKIKIKTFPLLGTIRIFLSMKFGIGPEIINLLDFVNYKKNDAIKKLVRIGWREYGDKHFESTFTKFYQSYILPTKFNIDKRKTHLSCQIRNNEILRSDAMQILKNKPYNDNKIEFDIDYISKKLNITKEKFKEILSLPPKLHTDYPSDQFLINIYNLIKKIF